jgi:ubiquinone/menaquinone biosynthesis C-methylase UbiE
MNRWKVMDMTNMEEFEDNSFDMVIDKAAMDALTSCEGDVWNPDITVVESARAMLRHISRILRHGGLHVHVSLSQPHFRKKYLLGWHNSNADQRDDTYSDEFGWSLSYENAGCNTSEGSFGHYIYFMMKT